MTSSTDPVPFAFVFDVRGRVVLADASGSANTYRVLPQVRSAQAARRPPMARPQHAGSRRRATTSTRPTPPATRSPVFGGTRQLDLLHADGISATTDAGPIDIAAAPDGRQVFELNGLAGDLGVYAVAPDGALTLTATVHGLPAYDGSNGMAGTVAT
jgi:hypothetical protein